MAYYWCVSCMLVTFLPLTTAKGPPQVSQPYQRQQMTVVGRTLRLACPVTADPPPLLQWTKDAESIHRGWERFKVQPQGLRIKDVQLDDGGNYVCKATNGFGHVTIQYMLYVLADSNDTSVPSLDWDDTIPFSGKGVPPRFVRPEQMSRETIMRPVGSKVRLKCKAAGRPRPHISWYHNGKLLDTVHDVADDTNGMNDDDILYDDFGEGDEEDRLRHSRYTLSLTDLTEQHSGFYACLVRSRMGAINFTYTVDVVDNIKEIPQLVPPHPQNSTVSFGDKATFLCEVRSAAQPHIQWLKRVENLHDIRNHNATIEVNNQKFVVLTTGKEMVRQDGSYLNKLTLFDVSQRDAGMYICLGANTMGYSIRSAYLHVIQDSRMMHGINGDTETASFFQTTTFLLIVGIAGIILLFIIGIVIYILQRRFRSTQQKPPTTIRPSRVPNAIYSPQTPVGAPSEKLYEHQYAALQPAVPYQIHNDASHERSMKSYCLDIQRDGGTSAVGLVTPGPSMTTPAQQHLHSHTHYYSCT